MSTATRAIAFVLGLGIVFGAAFGIGRFFDSDTVEASPAGDHAHTEEYHLRLLDAPTAPGRHTLRFTIEDHDGATVTGFDVRHEKRLHLIVVDTAYAGYQHLHPTMDADGVWSTPFTAAAGFTQVYADFQETGAEDAVARADFETAGTVAFPRPSMLRTQQVDGYTVTALGDLTAGGTSALRFEISRNGAPVTDLQPYLGAYGHLVMLRKADGEYLHVHPEDGPAGPEIAFAATVPEAARYQLYLDFKHGDVVHTAQFVLDAGAGGAEESDGHGGTDGHGDH